MPSGWRRVKIGEIAKLINGRAYRADELLKEGKYPVLRVGNLFTNDHWYYSSLELEFDKYCTAGDLIYTWSASFGPFIWSGPKAIFHYHIWKVVCSESLDREYACYALKMLTERIRSGSHGLAMLHITKERMEKFEITLPPLSEQQRIVKVLREQMAVVDKARAAAQAQLDTTKTLIPSLLGQFFPRSSQHLPIGWRSVRLCEVCDLRLGKMLSPASKTGNRNVPYLRNVNVQWNRFDLTEIAEMDFTEQQETTLLLKPGDLLVCEGGEPGRAAVWEGQIRRCCYQKALHRLRPIEDAIDPYFMMFRLWQGSFNNEFTG
jgi:type I restriction enzyme S subunit